MESTSTMVSPPAEQGTGASSPAAQGAGMSPPPEQKAGASPAARGAGMSPQGAGMSPPAEQDHAERVARRFVEVAHEIVWCTLATVDRRNRPRSRVVHPLWEPRPGGAPAGWVTTRPTPLKLAHLGHSPFASCSYWDPRHHTAVAECRAAWVDDPVERRRVWDLVASTPPPLGHDPAAIWPDGPDAPGFALLRLEPWRLRVARAEEMAAGTALSCRYEASTSGASLSSAGTGSPTTFQ